ncbi:MAG: Na/Pi symporter [Thiobacillus sp.]
MLRRILLPSIFLVLAWGFWVSPDFNEIAAGVAIFLFGMLSLEEGFKAFTGGVLEKLLRVSTDRLWKSVSFGIVSTTVMQSSSLVSVLSISFLSAGLIGLAQGIGIIFGANLGTTTGAWLVAGLGLKVNISAYAMPMLVFGVILLFQSTKVLKGIGYVLMGLGFLFLGIHHMKVGFESFKSAIDLAQFAVPGLIGLLLYTFIGTLATVIMQSSHATLVLIITALAAHQITYENALALAIGANIGTTITAILGAIGANVEGRRLAAAHLLFNAVTGLIAIVFIYPFIWAVDSVSHGIGIAADNYTLKLAVFHTLFNLVGIVVMLPFIQKLVSLLERILKDQPRKVSMPHFINDAVAGYPDAALKALRQEIQHLFSNAFDVIALVLNVAPAQLRKDTDQASLAQPPETVRAVDIDDHYDRRIKSLYNAIVDFIARVKIGPETKLQGENLYALRDASRNIVEAVKDIKHLQKNLLRYLDSPNPHIRQEYNGIRQRLALLLKDIHVLAEDPDTEALLALDGLRADLFADDALASGNLERLIRGGHITPEMATSLMNDSSYAHDVANNLINMAKVLFSPKETIMNEVQESLSLEEPDFPQ